MIRKCYAVVGFSGAKNDRIDYREWIVAIHLDEDEAESHREKASEAASSGKFFGKKNPRWDHEKFIYHTDYDHTEIHRFYDVQYRVVEYPLIAGLDEYIEQFSELADPVEKG